jgi:hypothetical protein
MIVSASSILPWVLDLVFYEQSKTKKSQAIEHDGLAAQSGRAQAQAQHDRRRIHRLPHRPRGATNQTQNRHREALDPSPPH